ncbi:hypothetical protein GCM10028810_01430 [Spirosoma litoris]
MGLFHGYWSDRGHNFPGNIAHLLTSRYFTDYGGVAAGLDGLQNRDHAYSVSVSHNPSQAEQYPTYSREVKVITHELGHNFGSPHTHWCGWPGGAIDNCGTPEPYLGNSCNGPDPVNGGTIMSYCDHGGASSFSLGNGFGPYPGDKIRTKIAEANLPITTSDGIISSVASGSWSTASTWACGIAVNATYDASVSSGDAVQINFTEAAKSLNVNGVLNLSSSSSTLNINNN